MSSGELRGLQILKWGASTVLGGFDSHTFPPLKTGAGVVWAAAVALVLVGGTAAADEGEGTGPPVIESPAEPVSSDGAPFEPSPRGALVRSMAVPGWGQLYNRSPIKSVLFAAGQITLAVRGVRAQRDADDYERMAESLESGLEQDALLRAKNRALDRRDDFIWWSAFALLFSSIEAYVDASLWTIGAEFEGVDTLPPPDRSFRFSVLRSF